MIEIEKLNWPESGLLPAIVRDVRTRAVLMLAWMNRESLQESGETGETWFWSRSRHELWNKGVTSGNRQNVVNILTDCDGDALLVDVEPAGPACHSGEYSCFGDGATLVLDSLASTLRERKQTLPEDSYSATLFRAGRGKIVKKIGEEATEVVVAATSETRERLISEVADLLFHMTALLVNEGVELSEIAEELQKRRK